MRWLIWPSDRHLQAFHYATPLPGGQYFALTTRPPLLGIWPRYTDRRVIDQVPEGARTVATIGSRELATLHREARRFARQITGKRDASLTRR